MSTSDVVSEDGTGISNCEAIYEKECPLTSLSFLSFYLKFTLRNLRKAECFLASVDVPYSLPSPCPYMTGTVR